MWSYNNVCVDTGMKRQVVFYPLYSVVITVTSKSFMLRFCIMLVVKQLYNRSELLTLSCEYQDGFFYDFADFFFNFIFLVNYNKTKVSSGQKSSCLIVLIFVQNSLHKNCSNVSPPPEVTNDSSWCSWAPFGQSQFLSLVF